MSHIPNDVIRHVESGRRNEARVAVNRIGGTIEEPTLAIVCNAMGAIAISGILKHAVDTAPTPEDKEAWRGLGLQITAAIIGAVGGHVE